jgi:hypothetical protein
MRLEIIIWGFSKAGKLFSRSANVKFLISALSLELAVPVNLFSISLIQLLLALRGILP